MASSSQTQFPVDMTTKVGGRVFQPSLPVVDGAGPSVTEQGFQSTLEEYCREHIPIESDEGIKCRERVLNEMGALCRDWIRSVGRQKGLPADVVEGAGGALYTSGSYRLGVHEPGADIDCILVAPAMCSRQEFFGTTGGAGDNEDDDDDNPNYRDPNSLAERLRAHPEVTNFVPVEGAAVPILTFDWEGINIDLLFARLNLMQVSPTTFDIDNDAVLDGADGATEKSLNGPRVTNLIAAFVSGTPARYQAFLTVVRCVRKWAKARGLYSNKMGYWGGVNCNLAVALTVQLYPNACPAVLLRRFFLVFKTWRWPQPVLLTKPHNAGYGLTVWSPSNAMRQVAPMITPAYPAMNSTLAVSRQTLQIMQEEFNRGHEIVDHLWKEYQKDPSTKMNWSQLFEPSDFFISYPRYLSLCIVGPSQADAQAWAGFVESRLRKLVSDLLARSLPLKKIQLWPKKMDVCIADKTALLTAAQRQNCITYFIGFQIDKHRMRGNELNVEIPLYSFREYELGRFQPLVPGMDILVKSFGVKELPQLCFEGMYEGGKVEAMHKRRRLRNEDPVRQERRRLQRLAELKAKMEEIKRKKEEQQNRKRTREEVELEEESAVEQAVKEEELQATTSATQESANDGGDATSGDDENEETDLLESAFDTMQDDTAGDNKKTREEAEADRQKLLSGELLVEGGAVDSDDEEAGYIGDGARRSLYNKKATSAADAHKDKRSLPPTEEEEEVLRGIGFPIVSDDETKLLGVNMIPPWRGGGAGRADEPLAMPKKRQLKGKITLLRKFDVVELDARGYVIDKGDEDFTPSKSWIGRKAGFEFKMGLRGLGYYRTGKPVVVPSNTAY